MPAVTAALIMVFFDRNFSTNFFVAAAGGDPLLYQHLFWLFGHPEVYILILPGMGIVSEILPVFARKPLFGRSVVIFSGIAIGFLGWGVWAHHMFATGLGPVATTAFGLSTMLIAIPTGVKIFNWIGTVWGGSLRLNTPMLFSLGFIAMFTIGGLSGVTHSIVPADTQQTDTYYVVAHFHYVLFGGLVFAIFGGFYYWWPKIFGRMLDDKIGKVNFWLMLIGFNLTFFPMHILGLAGPAAPHLPLRVGMGWDLGNQLATIGAFVIAFVGAGVPRERLQDAPSGVRWRAPTRGTAARWSGRSRRRCPSTTSPRSPRSTRPTTSGTASTPRTRRVGSCGSRPAAPTTAPPPTARRNGHGIHLPSPSFFPLSSRSACRSSATRRCSRTRGSRSRV